MDTPQLNTVRTATYLAAQQRTDLRGALATRTGKTRGVKCNPPNVRCGGRCIPPTWDCRLQGKGTNSELAAHSQDLLGGVASLQRGSRDLVKGLRTANPELINRGRNSLVRGAVKIAPGDSLQEKKRLKQTIQRNSRPIITALTLGVVGYAAHNGLKRSWPGYARGAGRQLDEAVGHAYNSVLDRTPFLGARRAAARAAGSSAISQAAQQLLRGSDLARRTSEMASTNPLRPGLAATLGIGADIRGSNLINNYDALVRSSKGAVNKDTWLQKSRELVYGATDQRGRSIYSTDASAYLLTKQFRLDPRGVLGERNRTALTTSGRRARLQSGLATRLNDLSTAMQRDMATRGMNSEDYMRRVVRPQIQATTAGVRNGRVAANQEAEDFLGRLLTSTGRPAHLSHARELIGKTETHFNTVFSDLARNINRTAASADSPADEATLGFARFLSSHSRGPATRVVNTEHANLYLEGVFQRRVNGNQSPIEISRPAAIRVAKAIGGHAVDPTPEGALEILRLQGGITARFASTAPSGARPQQSLTAIARRIMQSQGLSYEAALRQARNEVARRRRRDAAEDGTIRTATYLAARADAAGAQRLGKPCGAGHIAKALKCSKTAASTASDNRGRTAALAAGAALTTAGLLAYRSRSTLVPGLSQSAIRQLSAAQVKAGLDKLPEQFREPARQLVGDAKRAAAHMALRAQGAQIKAVDVDHNFSTWVTATGTHLSVGSVGDSLLTFGAERKANIGKFPQFGLGFTIDTNYDAAGGMPSSQAKQLIRTTKAMYKAQLDMLPEDAFLFAVPHKADGKGTKRKSIYEGMGFRSVPGLKGDKLWALKNQGKFSEIPDNQVDMIRSMIRGDEADKTAPIPLFAAAIT